MQKIDVVLAKYKQLLRRKSVRELKYDINLLGGPSYNGNKQDYITKIVMLAQNNQTAFQKIINMIQGTISIKVPNNERQTFFRRQLNKQKLKQLREIEQVKRAGYGKIYENMRLIDFLQHQLTPAQQVYTLQRKLRELQIEMKNQKLNQKIDILKLLKYNEENQEIEQLQGSKRKRLKTFVNDYKQKVDKQDPEHMKENIKKNHLHWMNIQTQIILPNYLITQNYQNTEEQLKFVMQSQDTNSFNRYLKQKMPPQMRRLRSKAQKTGVIRVLSQAISAMRALKQVNYIRYDILEVFLRNINHSELNGEAKSTNTQKKVINQFIKQERKYRKYFTDYFRTYPIEKNIKIIRKILNLVEIEHKYNTAQQENTQIILNSLQFCFYLESSILSWLQKQQASQNEQKTQSIIRNLITETITTWINYSQKVKINNLQKLANILRLMNQFLYFMDYIDSVVPLGQNQISFEDYYQNIQKQIFQCFTNLFYTEVLTPNLVNQIIINFQKVLGQAQLPIQVLKCIGNIGNRIKTQLTTQAKKSIIKIFGIRPGFQENVNICELIRQVTERPILYGLKQSILAIELVIKYQLSDRETLIRNIILLNIDPKQLNEKLKQYVLKLVKQNTSTAIQSQILQYLQ